MPSACLGELVSFVFLFHGVYLIRARRCNVAICHLFQRCVIKKIYYRPLEYQISDSKDIYTQRLSKMKLQFIFTTKTPYQNGGDQYFHGKKQG